jgi:subtilase family serine protease
MRVNGTEPPTVRVASLGARKSRLVTFTAAGCASGSKMHFEADFSKELAEPNEANNVAEIACPVVGG